MLSSNARPLQTPFWPRRIYSVSFHNLKVYFNAIPCTYVFQKASIHQIYLKQILKYFSHWKCVPYFSYSVYGTNKICCAYQFLITWIQSLGSPCEIGGIQSGQKKGFYRNISASLVGIIMPMLHSHLFSHRGRHVILTHFSRTFWARSCIILTQCGKTFWARPFRKIKLPARQGRFGVR